MTCFKELDKEWLELIVEAKNLGLEISTIQNFLNSQEVREFIRIEK
jgi:DNA-binding transcriptional MerR regulator